MDSIEPGCSRRYNAMWLEPEASDKQKSLHEFRRKGSGAATFYFQSKANYTPIAYLGFRNILEMIFS